MFALMRPGESLSEARFSLGRLGLLGSVPYCLPCGLCVYVGMAQLTPQGKVARGLGVMCPLMCPWEARILGLACICAVPCGLAAVALGRVLLAMRVPSPRL